MCHIMELKLCDLAAVFNVWIGHHLNESVHIVRDTHINPDDVSRSICCPTYRSLGMGDCVDAHNIIVSTWVKGKAIALLWYFFNIVDQHVSMGACKSANNVTQPIVL